MPIKAIINIRSNNNVPINKVTKQNLQVIKVDKPQKGFLGIY